jgi:hypothetical protein
MTAIRLARRLLLVFVVVLGGCYSYVAIGARPPAAGNDLQVELASARDVTLQDVTVHGITGIQGRALTADAESLGVAVIRLWGLEGRSFDATGIGVRIPRNDIAVVRVKRLSPTKSVLATAAGSAAIVAVIFSIRQIVGSGGGGRPKPMP